MPLVLIWLDRRTDASGFVCCIVLACYCLPLQSIDNLLCTFDYSRKAPPLRVLGPHFGTCNVQLWKD